MLVSPAEPKIIQALGTVSGVPERYGVDMLWASPLGSVGVQRKELHDFFGSMADGRFVREFPQMAQLGVAVLVIEGQQRWSTEGYLMDGNPYSRRAWTRDMFRSYCLSVMSRGVWVVETDGIEDTVKWVKNFERWSAKPAHNSLATRPKPQGAWGKPENRDWNIFLLQSFPGIGVTHAEHILDHFDGAVPIGWTCTRAEMLKVPGMGKTRVETLWAGVPENAHAPAEPEKPTRKKTA